MNKYVFIAFFVFNLHSLAFSQKLAKNLKIDYSPIYSLNGGSELKKIIPKSKYQVFVFFDAKCSFCIVSFIDLLKQIDSIGQKQNFRYLFIAESGNLFLTNHFLRKLGVVLHKNQLLLCDEKGSFLSKNKFIDASSSSLYMVIADKKNVVIKMGHPMNLLKFYTSLSALKEVN